MPGPFVGQVFYFCQNRGWTDTYYPLGTTHAACMANMQSVVAARALMSCPDVTFENIRVSDMTIRGDALNGAPTASNGSYAGVATSTDPDVALLVRQIGVGFLKRAVRYLRGLPNTTFTFSPLLYTGLPAGFVAALNNYLTILLTTTQLVERIPGPPVTYTQTAISSIVIERATIRRAGRPFGQQPGRRVRA